MSSLTDYFALLGLAPVFDVDLQALEAAYFKAQRQYHPDRFVGKPQAERQQAMQISVDINNAYTTLKDPHNRACYLLKQQGIEVGDSKTAQKPSQELLVSIMEWREQVQEAQDEASLSVIDGTLAGLQNTSLAAISQAFLKTDWNGMAEQTMRLGYLVKTRGEIAQMVKRLKLRA
jgi:molecular chaperone HscB